MQSNQLHELLINNFGNEICNHPNYKNVFNSLTEKFANLQLQNELAERASHASVDAYNKLLFVNKQLSNELNFINEKTKKLILAIAKEKGVEEFSSMQLDETFQIGRAHV